MDENEKSIRIVTMSDLTTFTVQNITMQKNSYLKTIYNEINCGYKIKSTVMHPSEDYLITLLYKNSIVINRLETKQTCGEINLNDSTVNSYNIVIDPSGLYVGILADVKKNYIEKENDLNIQNEYKPNNEQKYLNKSSIVSLVETGSFDFSKTAQSNLTKQRGEQNISTRK